MTKFLKGDLKKQHWNQSKQLFTPSCPYRDDNNDILALIKQKYHEYSVNWVGSIAGMLASMDERESVETNGLSLSGFIHHVIAKLQSNKHADGSPKCSHEAYEKCEKRLQEYCASKKIKYQKLMITDLTPGFVNDVFSWINKSRKGKGMGYVSPMLHSLITKAEKAGLLKLDDFRNCQWWKKKSGSSQKNRTLTDEQCRKLATLDLWSISKSRHNELYRDFCLFLLYTGQSPCDARSLKYSDIKQIHGVSHFVFNRRKIAEKQAVPCCVPINAEMDRIMLRWRRRAKDGYVFPIRTKSKVQEQQTENGDIKHFVGRLNHWLKKVGDALGYDFHLRTYTFRHTAITRYVSRNVPIMYLSNMMGTSVENIEKIYYDNHADIASRNKLLTAMSF